jgi:quercetin dioxygenase-like cupin family protein
MSTSNFQVRQLKSELLLPASGKQSKLIVDDAKVKVLLFAFAAGSGLAEHVAPLPAIIQILEGAGAIIVGDETIVAEPGTWIRIDPSLRHSVQAESPMLLLLTLLKDH